MLLKKHFRRVNKGDQMIIIAKMLNAQNIVKPKYFAHMALAGNLYCYNNQVFTGKYKVTFYFHYTSVHPHNKWSLYLPLPLKTA